ncbi:class I SAM-dependent methyltransferase [Leucobacter iarius]|uniref:Class I SAM-dependent methyltransferase n=1 Tax=Leucobacter iarius TaxID=333963 RepID=A0ABN2LFM1_9MICO
MAKPRRRPRGDAPGSSVSRPADSRASTPRPSAAPGGRVAAAGSVLPGWDELATPAGLELLDRIDASTASGLDAAAIGRGLRAEGTDPGLIAAALTQHGLRVRAAAKFGSRRAARMLFTPAGLEQASRFAVAERHAARFRAAGSTRVADLGCGIGTESLAVLEAGLVPRAVELDPLTATFAAHNLAIAGADDSVRVGDAEALSTADADAAFLDPARRTAGHRDTRRLAGPDDYAPSLGFAFGLAERMPTGIKLGPGFDRELIPVDAEAQWVSVGGQLVEMGLWFGAAARPGVRRSALVLRASGDPDPEPVADELHADADADDAEVRPLGGFLYEPDGAVIRARLIGLLAEQLRAGMLSDGIAYLTGDALVPTPFATAFRVLETLPVKEAELRRALAERSIGTLEIKKRGIDVDPAALRTRLKLRGAERATLVLTRAAGKHTALLVERC